MKFKCEKISFVSSNVEQDMFVIRTVNNRCQQTDLWTLNLKLNNKILKCNIDTSEEDNVMSISKFILVQNFTNKC